MIRLLLTLMGLLAWAHPLAVAAGAEPALPAPASASSLPPGTSAAPDRPLPAALRDALQQAQIPPDSLYLWVAPVDGGPDRLSHQADRLAHPASLMKLVTSAAALERLGRSHVWRTRAYVEAPPRGGRLAGPLYIQGGGDPKLVHERLWLLLRQVRQLGIDEVGGDIVLDRRAFALPEIDPGAFDGEPLRPYNVRPDPLMVNFKSVTLNFRPDPDSQVARVSADLSLAGWRADDTVPLGNGPCNDWRAELKADFGSPNRWRFAGRYPRACGERQWPVAYNEPASHAARAIEAQWKALGGRLHGRVRDGAVPDGLVPVLEFTSPPLVEVLRDMNTYSNNPIAQHLLLALSPQQPATLETARRGVTDLLGSVGCASDELRLDNGSGLSRDERITPRCLGRWLQWAWRQPWMPDFYASLPMAGESTARRAVSVAGRAHLKTGSLNDVAAIAGLLHGPSGRRLVAVVILNHPAAGRDAARLVLDAALGWARDELDAPQR